MLARNKNTSLNEYEGWTLLSGVIRKVSQRGKDTAFPQRQESTFQQEPKGSVDTVQAMMWENNIAQSAEGLAASGRPLFYSQASTSHRSIFREGNDKLPALL